jgi:molybdenum cofactor cytidylyltransferase
MSPTLRIGGLVLAAGASRRFGADKREARLAAGETLLARTLASIAPAVDELVLVIGEGDRLADFAARYPQARVLRAPRSRAGMGCSLADAVGQLPHWDACLVMLADKPFLQPGTALQLRALLAVHALVVPTWRGEWGHPVGFARQHFQQLTRLEGDRGARELIVAERDRCCFVECADPGVVADVDTAEQLAYWSALLEAG